MADKDVDEQFAAIMAHWHEDALGLDPSGDPDPEPEATPDVAPDATTPDAATPDGVDAPRPTDAAVPVDVAAPPVETAAPPAPAVDDDPPPSVVNPAPVLSPQRASALGWREHVPVPSPEDEHFVPPPPAPLPSSDDKHFWLMMLGLVGGPLLFLYLVLFDRDGNGWWMVLGLAMTVAGFVLLVLRQPFERDEDDDGVRL